MTTAGIYHGSYSFCDFLDKRDDYLRWYIKRFLVGEDRHLEYYNWDVTYVENNSPGNIFSIFGRYSTK